MLIVITDLKKINKKLKGTKFSQLKKRPKSELVYLLNLGTKCLWEFQNK